MSYPVSPYIEERNGGLYVAGARVGLDVVVHEFRNGRSAESILEAYPTIGSLAKVYGAITYLLEHPAEIEAYLAEQDRKYREIQSQYPLTEDMLQRLSRAKTGRPA